MSRAAPTSFKEPGETPDSLMDTLRSLWHDIPRLFSDRVELLSLELHRAGLALLQIVVLGIGLAVVGITAWLILWSLIITGLTLVGLHWMGAFALALAVHVMIGTWLVLRVKTLLPKLRLPATRRHLMFSSSPGPVTPTPRTHDGLPTERSDHDRVFIP
ncbi:phage holin family protein [Hydrogenophaga sp.]|uniref:phage holin family protein n=1 Tax=Hydrogenophaga sp. TaxID=1904254 RepID=UPI0025C57CA5|nr:phage holin family protein [Hydrogenophaga sp.]MBT9463025.1 phage holin family protein [Hydrogenophaga sp.]